MKYPERSQYKYAKSRYRVRNWAEYEAGLQKRGDMTVWLSDAALDGWRAPASGKPGGQRTYADIAIEAALTIRMVFHLPLRQTEGFLRSLADLLKFDLPIPDHTTLSQRLKKLNDIRIRRLATDLTGRRTPNCARVHGIEREEPQHPLDPRTRSPRMAEALRLQQARHRRERDLSIQDDHRSKDAKSNLRWTTSWGTAAEQDPQHDDQSRDARQLPSHVSPARGKGDLSSVRNHAPTPPLVQNDVVK